MLTFVVENNRLLTGEQSVRPLAEVLQHEFLPNLFAKVTFANWPLLVRNEYFTKYGNYFGFKILCELIGP